MIRIKILFTIVLLFCSMQASAQDIITVSLINLISTPEKYDGKLVSYLHHKFEDSGLYVSKEAGDYLLTQSAVWLSYSDSVILQDEERSQGLTKKDMTKFDSGYVLIEGTFIMTQRGHKGMYAGGIDNVRRVMQLTPWYAGKRQLKK